MSKTLVAVLLSVNVAACGGAHGSKSIAPRVSSGSALATTAGSSAPVAGHLTGDYDDDDYSVAHFGDADNDDSSKPKDKDNDFDNSTGSYYDRDDSSIRDFGHAASPTDSRAITTLVKRYYAAAAADDGMKACALLVPTMATAVPEDLGRSPGPSYFRGRTCADVMSKVFDLNHRQLNAYNKMLRVTGVRLDSDRGLVILGFKAMPGRQILVSRGNGVWRVAKLLDSELP